MIANIPSFAIGIAALAACGWALRHFCRSDALGLPRVRSLAAVYALIYGVMFVGGAGLIFVGYGVGLDQMYTPNARIMTAG